MARQILNYWTTREVPARTLLLVIISFKIYSLSNFQICNTVLTVIAMVYSTCPPPMGHSLDVVNGLA